MQIIITGSVFPKAIKTDPFGHTYVGDGEPEEIEITEDDILELIRQKSTVERGEQRVWQIDYITLT